MTEATARRLFDTFVGIELRYRLLGIPVDVGCRRAAHRFHGETRRELLRVAALGTDAATWLTFFLTSLDADHDPRL